MSEELDRHLLKLDCRRGSTMGEIRRAYRLLSFVWHPDRHPEVYRDVAQEKLQEINASYQWLLTHPDQLSEPQEVDSIVAPDPSAVDEAYRAKSTRCTRCHGSGEVATGVEWNGEFSTESCDICLGAGALVVDDRNVCRCCEGTGLNEGVTQQERKDWIDSQMRMRGWFDRHLNPNEYKRLWLQFHREHMVCSSCKGSGYFFQKPDMRKGERRKSSALDFLMELDGVEKERQKDRRSAS
jgi:DnaJ-class molecular chaperone